MAQHSGKTMTFAADLLPQEDGIYNLGDADQKWNIFGNLGTFNGYSRIDITGSTLDLNTLTLSDGTTKIKRYIERTDGGASKITNLPVTGKPFILDVELICWSTTTDYITLQTFRNASKPANEYVRYCTNGTWGNWTTRVFTDTNNYHTTGSWSGLTYTATAVGDADELKFTLPTATSEAFGVVKTGDGITNTEGVISVTAANLGLTSALKYVGAKNSLPAATSSTTYSAYNNGDVITVSYKEYAYVKGSSASKSKWVELGDEGSYKIKQSAISAPTAETNKWVSSIGQDDEGVISASYTALDTSGTWSGTASFVGKGEHTAVITANEFTPATGTLTVLGRVANTSMPNKTNNANAEIVVKAHPTSGTNYYEARLGFNSNGNLYHMPVNGNDWRTILDSTNYTTYAVSLDGSNMTATVANDLYVPYMNIGGTLLASGEDIDRLNFGTYYANNKDRAKLLNGTVPSVGAGFKLITIGGYLSDTRYQFAASTGSYIMYRTAGDYNSTNTSWTQWKRIVYIDSNEATTARSTDNPDELVTYASFSAVGNSTTPVYVTTSGAITACTPYANASVNYANSAGSANSASKLSNTIAIGSNTQPVYFTTDGVPQATATEMLRAFTGTDAGTDMDQFYDSGMYSITEGTLTHYPTGGSKYAAFLTVAYRKPSGNTIPDYAWQMGNCTQNTNRLWYRTSTKNSWREWRQFVNIPANTAVGDTDLPVYVNANGEVNAITSLNLADGGSVTADSFNGDLNGNASSASKISATLDQTHRTYLLGTQTTITGTAANVLLTGDTGVYLTNIAGELSAQRYSWHYSSAEKVYTEWNNTDESLDFIFA